MSNRKICKYLINKVKPVDVIITENKNNKIGYNAYNGYILPKIKPIG